MKYCKYCGSQLDDDAAVCSKCGKVLGDQQGQTVIIQQVEKTEQKKNGCGVAGFVLGLISLVICSWVCIFLGWYTLPLPALAFVLSLVGIIVGKKKQQSIGLGIAGLILSAVALISVISVISFLYSVI